MPVFNDNKYEIMNAYLRSCCNTFLTQILKSFSNGIGCTLNDISCVFADDPDENDPKQKRECPELIDFDGVGFFSEHFPEPLLISYQEFYDNLKAYINKYVTEQSETSEEIKMYLEAIRIRYALK